MKLSVAFFYLLIHVSQCGRVIRPYIVGDNCRTPFSHTGDCREIVNCQVLLDLTKQTDGQRSADASAVLRDSRCGLTRVDPPLYCCPHLTPKQPETCGKGGPISRAVKGHSIVKRIIGGGPAEPEEWPWMAMLGRRLSKQSKVELVCGGTLVTDRHVISAAHCIYWNISIVRLGDVNINDGVDMEVESSVRHPKYDKKSQVNDIAVIKMKGQVSINGRIRPICLPNAATGLNSFVGLELYVAGWGRLGYERQAASVLHHVKVPVESEKSCKEAYSEAVIDEKIICAGNSEKNACEGDSGGPLMHVKDDLFYIIGVVSYGTRCDKLNHPGVYTKVSYYMDWINANLNRSLTLSVR